MQTRTVWLATVVAALLVGAREHSIAETPFDPAIDLQTFEYAIGPRSFLTVSDADVAAKSQVSADVLLSFMTSPFTVYDYDENTKELIGERAKVVESVLAAEFSGAYGVTDRLQVGVSLPVILSMTGDGVDPGMATPSADGLQATGLGDLRAEAKIRLLQHPSMRVAATGGVTVPTSFGTSNDFLGDDTPSLRGRLAVQWSDASNRLTAGINAGLLLRKPRTVFASEVGQQFLYGAAGALQVNKKLAVIAELFGRGGITGSDGPSEINGAVRFAATNDVSVLAGGGAGLAQSIGAPGLRVFVSVGWSPDKRDDDGDGIVNSRDKCPVEAEDRDGWEDNDGCPDADNDGDKRPDSSDKCPNKREDLDGFEDDDGCPELDNDGDKIVDAQDRCPEDAEDGKQPFPKDGCPANKRDTDSDGVSDLHDKCPDKEEDEDGFEDWDGCPEEDNDNDGVLDGDDKCPLCPEDGDGFQDDDGCPDLDDDQDGVPDTKDKCPKQKETMNGYADEDGCPDKRAGPQFARLNGDRITTNLPIKFNRRDRIRPGRDGLDIVHHVAALMRGQVDVTQWLVVVAMRKRGSDDATRARSAKRGNVLKTELVRLGVAPDKIHVVGAISPNPTVAIAARERKPRVIDEAGEPVLTCPALLKVAPREPPPGHPVRSKTSESTDDDSPDL